MWRNDNQAFQSIIRQLVQIVGGILEKHTSHAGHVMFGHHVADLIP